MLTTLARRSWWLWLGCTDASFSLLLKSMMSCAVRSVVFVHQNWTGRLWYCTDTVQTDTKVQYAMAFLLSQLIDVTPQSLIEVTVKLKKKKKGWGGYRWKWWPLIGKLDLRILENPGDSMIKQDFTYVSQSYRVNQTSSTQSVTDQTVSTRRAIRRSIKQSTDTSDAVRRTIWGITGDQFETNTEGNRIGYLQEHCATTECPDVEVMRDPSLFRSHVPFPSDFY